MDYYLCMQVLLKRPICEQWPFPRCPNIKIALQLLFAEPVTVRRAAAEPASCPGARGAGHRPPLTALPAPPPPHPACAAAHRPAPRAPGGPAPLRIPQRAPLPPGAGRVSKARSGSSLPAPYSSGHESRIKGQSCLASLIAYEFQDRIFMWTVFERCHVQIYFPCKT